jgi:hypothetical protein
VTTTREQAADLAARGFGSVETEVWEPNPDQPGYLRRVRQRTVSEVYKDLRSHVGQDPEGGEEYFDIAVNLPNGETPWPTGRIAVFSVRGGSEGDYTHVEVGGKLVLLAKTFQGRDASWRFARYLADLLGV